MQVIIKGPNLPGALENLKIFAKAHGLEILNAEPLSGTGGRPRARVDFVSVCESLRGRIEEKGAIKEIALEYGISPAWVYKWVVPVIRACNNPRRSMPDR